MFSVRSGVDPLEQIRKFKLWSFSDLKMNLSEKVEINPVPLDLVV